MSGTAIYNLLGIEPKATSEEIKAAFHSQALKTHPDKNPNDPAAAERFARIKKAYDLLSDEPQRKDWHRRYKLPWIWSEAKGSPQATDEPPADLNWACAACHGVAAYQCMVCRVRLCPHFTIMVQLDGFNPKPVCTDCKRDWNDRKHAQWKLKQMIKQRMGGIW